MRRRIARQFAAAVVGLAAALAAPSLGAAPAFAPAGSGQSGLAVGTDAQGVLRAKLCASAPCDVASGLDLGVPVELRSSLARATIKVVGIGSGRRAVVVSVPGAKDGRVFEIVVLAPLSGTNPKVVFAGLTGLVEGSEGVREGKRITISEPDDDGARRIVIGLEREGLDLCGRHAVLAPELLNPDDLSLRPARVQRLSASERAQAAELRAVVTPSDAPWTATGGVLRALGASSAVGAPQALTDGKLDTSWAENVGGAGRGEFVVMGAPPDLPITGFDLVVSAASAPVDASAVPRELWLATTRELFHVSLPDEAKSVPGARFRVSLPKPIKTDCLALVEESAFVEKPTSRVAVFELSVSSEFEHSDPKALVGALAGGGERARAAGSVLRALGEPGFVALVENFDQLDDGGRDVALDVLDAAPCTLGVSAYASALASRVEAQALHGQSGVRRCGRASADALAARFGAAKGELMTRYANELTIVAPDRAVEVFTARLSRARMAERRALRVVLARASSAREAEPVVRRLLADSARPVLVTLDLLRAQGSRLAELAPEANAALTRAAADASFPVLSRARAGLGVGAQR